MKLFVIVLVVCLVLGARGENKVDVWESMIDQVAASIMRDPGSFDNAELRKELLGEFVKCIKDRRKITEMAADSIKHMKLCQGTLDQLVTVFEPYRGADGNMTANILILTARVETLEAELKGTKDKLAECTQDINTCDENNPCFETVCQSCIIAAKETEQRLLAEQREKAKLVSMPPGDSHKSEL